VSSRKNALKLNWALHLLVLVVVSFPVFAQGTDTVYTVSLAQAGAHLVRVKIDVPAGSSERDIQMPVWDALYQVRDFPQYVNWVRTTDAAGHPLDMRNVKTGLWHISGASNGAQIEYEIFANVPGPYGAEINFQHAFFNLAQVLMYPIDARNAPIRLRFTDVPANWHIATALENSGQEFLAPNYDRLVDSPVEIGEFKEADFDEDGVHYRIVVDAQPADYDMKKVVATVRPIVATETAWMNDHSFQTFVFFYHFPRGPGGGGMEHANSTAIEVTAQALQDDALSLPGVTAHEFFHLWNVKRIRPQSLEPRDFSKENYTTALWFSEGFTNTVGQLSLLRAGIIDRPQYLIHLASAIAELERRPAHLTQSAEEASLDCWLEKYDYYRRPERSISYYNKGELIGILLDLRVREASNGAASLRDVFQWMNTNYARKARFFPDTRGVQEAAEAVTHADLTEFFRKYVAGVERIPWNEFLSTVGLRLEQKRVELADPGFTLAHNFGAPPVVVSVARGSEAERAGLSAGDLVLEMDGHAASRDFDVELARLRPGDMLRLQIKNALGKRELQWKVAANEQVHFELTDMDNITRQQRKRREAWFSGETETSGANRP
jgi:predicted metalloprotease with PDZ domain